MGLTEKEYSSPFVELAREKGKALFDRRVRQYLGISGEDFVRLYDEGAFNLEGPLHEKLISLVMLLPFYR